MTERDVAMEAHWRLAGGPLMDEATLMALFVAIGQVRAIEPARYDMNRRGKWRDYSGPRLVVDALTQRTQLVEIREAHPLDKGGQEVTLEMGKQGAPPSASLRWRQAWPPEPRDVQHWQEAVEEAFESLNLASMVITRQASGEEGTAEVRLGAVKGLSAGRLDRLRDCAGDAEPFIETDGITGWQFWEEEPPQAWQTWWSEQA